MEIFKKHSVFDFVKWSKYGLSLSVILVIICLWLFFGVGFTPGVDFAGGSVAQLKYNNVQEAPITEIRKALDKDKRFDNFQVSEFGNKTEVIIKLPYNASVKMNDLDGILHKELAHTGSFDIRKLDSVGPKVGNELAKSAILSLGLATIAMMAYVSFRYEWRFALASIITLVHDIVITAASVIVFHVDLNLEVIAALLTLLGYSINDTIIIFDRIREKMLEGKTDDINLAINEAISNTLSRTVFTSLTMFLVVLTLYIFGGQIIIGFSLPLLVGVVFGTYSSMFVAPKLALLFGFSIKKYHAKELAKAKKREEKKKLRSMYESGQV
ncbi:protein translocase subunit SecF [Helicobacter sp. 11S02629-2]|uniref:protein translocase subunit SecF n=1 Tax=Helicobacter sp. 11S02629-2 TaxID=1476195 RepID=UPI000BA56088|nr:protein translocase subunit SecF [Helicobacter sp. 11S02629-2]PAF45475.1 protein-export membrane protein SecF [Helicobacter sp. 11S02629-2]